MCVCKNIIYRTDHQKSKLSCQFSKRAYSKKHGTKQTIVEKGAHFEKINQIF